jgi:hypothetical protein
MMLDLMQHFSRRGYGIEQIGNMPASRRRGESLGGGRLNEKFRPTQINQ